MSRISTQFKSKYCLRLTILLLMGIVLAAGPLVGKVRAFDLMIDVWQLRAKDPDGLGLRFHTMTKPSYVAGQQVIALRTMTNGSKFKYVDVYLIDMHGAILWKTQIEGSRGIRELQWNADLSGDGYADLVVIAKGYNQTPTNNPGVKTLVLSSENGTILSRAITLIADISVTENPQRYIDTSSFRDVPQEFMLIDGTGLLHAYDYKYP